MLVDREGRARVADFGIARAGASEITQTGSVLGTAQYLSPEQAQGLEVTATSDLYSIGVILYEALTGRVPFEADIAGRGRAEADLRAARARRRELNPQVPPALDAVVLRALAKDPAEPLPVRRRVHRRARRGRGRSRPAGPRCAAARSPRRPPVAVEEARPLVEAPAG